jgi:hypothetical protein
MLAILRDLNVTTFLLSNSPVLGQRPDDNLGFSGAILVAVSVSFVPIYESFKKLAWDTVETSRHVRKAENAA